VGKGDRTHGSLVVNPDRTQGCGGWVQPIERERGELERTSTVEAARFLPNAHARHDHPRAMLHVWEGERRGRHGRDGKR